MTTRGLLKLSFCAGLLFATLVAPSAALGQNKRPAARTPTGRRDIADKAFDEGERRYAAGEYEAALAAFTAADNHRPSPQTTRYLALCEDALGNFANAAAQYERFLAVAPAKMKADVDAAKKRLDDIRHMPAKLRVTSAPPGASVTLDGGKVIGTTPLDVDVEPGRHTLRLVLEGQRPAETAFDATFASAKVVHVDLEQASNGAGAPLPPDSDSGAAPTSPATPAAAPAGPALVAPGNAGRDRTAAYVSGGLAVGSTAAGVVLGVLALVEQTNFDELVKQKNSDPDAAHAAADRGSNLALLADFAFGAALTTGVASLTLLLLDSPAQPASPPGAAAKNAPRVVAGAKRWLGLGPLRF